MRPEIVEAAQAVWNAAVAPSVHIAGAEEEQVGRIAKIIAEHIDDLRIPLDWVEIRELNDFATNGYRLIATVRFALGTIVPREAMQDVGDVIAQASLVERVKRNLARELSEHPLAHHVETGGVVEIVNIEMVSK